MRPVLLLLATAIAVGCGGTQPSASHLPGPQRLALQLPQRVSAAARETTVIVLLVVGTEGPLTFAVEGLPAFASIEDNVIRVMPRSAAIGERRALGFRWGSASGCSRTLGRDRSDANMRSSRQPSSSVVSAQVATEHHFWKRRARPRWTIVPYESRY